MITFLSLGNASGKRLTRSFLSMPIERERLADEALLGPTVEIDFPETSYLLAQTYNDQVDSSTK